MPRKKKLHFRPVFLLALAVTGAAAVWLLLSSAVSGQEEGVFSQALKLADDIGRYNYESDVVQTLHPTERPENIGRRATTQNFALGGEFDRAAESLHMQFWPYGREINQSLEMRVEDGRTYGRAGEGEEWTEVEGGMDLFAPSGDPMGMLDVAENVRLAGETEDSLFPGELLPDEYNAAVTRYLFDLNGLRYAQILRSQMEAELRRRGELPPGMSIRLASQYVDMVGQGELWVDNAGLPLRQILHVEFPAESGAMEWVEADIVTDFSDWRPHEVRLLSLDWSDPGMATASYLRLNGLNPAALADHALILGFAALMAGFAALSLLRRRARVVQTIYSIVFITAIVGTPLLQSSRLAALDSKVADRHAADEAELAAKTEVEADRFNPHVDPLLQGNDVLFQDGLPVPRDPKDPAAGDPFAATADETVINAVRATDCTITTTSDCDGDGLLDHIEIYETGTWVDDVDSDNDGISDKMELQPFNVGGRTWYLDPRNPDSNGDGQPDSLECIGRVNVKPDDTLDTSVPAAACVDTDKDGVPDVYDFDDDADGVPDEVDDARLDHFSVSNQTFDLALKGLTTGESVLVDISIRPTDSSHLWWTNSEMTWPSDDRNGQIMNVLDQNLPNTTNNMMLSALLEISMPWSSDNPSRGLPVKSSFEDDKNKTIKIETSIDEWLDTGVLDSYNITVSQDTATGVLSAYIPLSLTRDIVGNSPVAWNGRMYYRLPTDAKGWGANHTVRMLWTVNMMNDHCEVPEGSTQTWRAYCQDDAHWQTSQGVVQLYYDDFIVTALDLTEDHNVDGLVVAQEQGATGASNYYDNYLWHLADTLDETFLGAQTIAGDRFTVDQIAAQTPNWGIPTNKLNITAYDSQPDMTTFLSKTTGDEFLRLLDKTVFPIVGEGEMESVLFVAERTLRTAGLSDGVSFSTNTFTFDLSSIKPVTIGLMRWQPYVYNGAGWVVQSLPAFQQTLGSDLKSVFTEEVVQGLAVTDTNYDFAQAQAGAILLAQSYYAGHSSGSVVLLDDGTGPLSTGPLNDADHAMPAEPVVSIAGNLLSETQDFYSRLSLSNLDLTTTDGEIQTVAAATWASLSSSRGLLMESLGGGSLGESASSGSQAAWQLDDYVNMMDFKSLALANSFQLLHLSLVGEARERFGETGAYDVGAYELVSAAFKLKSVYGNISKFQSGGTRSVGELKSIINDSYETWAWIGFAIDVVKDAGFFIYDWAAGKIRPDTPAFSQKLAETIADIIVHAVLLVLTLAIASTLLVAVLAFIFLFDAVVGFICDVAGVKPGSTVDEWVCSGIISDLVKIIAWIINDTTPLADLTHSGRLSAGLKPPAVVQRTSTPGIAAGNQISMTGVFTSSLYFSHPHWMGYLYADTQLQDSNLQKTTLNYEFQGSKKDINQELNGTSWTAVGGSGTYQGIPTGERFRHTFTTEPGLFELSTPGINHKFEAYLAEGFGMNEQDCWWFIVGEPNCSLHTYKDTNHSDLTDSIIFDIFPETIDEFRSLALIDNNRYRLAWDETFPALNDADGDGVPRSNDPNDSLPDSDGDGLSDFFENQYSLPIREPDIDADGLTDYWEVFYKTDPREADSDGDGLLDSEEVFHPNWIYPYENSALSDTNPPDNAPSRDSYAGGWEFVYAFHSATPLKMLVTADPLDPDTDDDTIDDLREKEYGYNPRVASALKILGLRTEVSASQHNTTLPVPYATLSSDLTYTAVINNELNSRYALGLLQTELPEDTVRATKELGVMQPLETVTMAGSRPISDTDLSASGTTSMTIRSGAIIDEGTGRSLWMHMNEPAGATTFVDSSYQGYEGVCISSSSCPTTNGLYWQMDSNDLGAVIPSDDDIITAGSGFTVATWLKPGANDVFGSLFFFDAFELQYSSYQGLNLASAWVDGSGTNLANLTSGKWSHLVVTYQPTGNAVGTLRSYLNGQLQQTTENLLADVHAQDAPVRVGWFGSRGSMNLKELEVYPEPLTSTQVQELYGTPSVQIDFAANEDVTGGSTVSCASGRCPTNGTAGDDFDQTQNLTLTGGPGLDFSGKAFTISTWIKPAARDYPFDTAAVEAWNDLFTLNGHGAQPPRDVNKDWQGVFGYGGFTSIPAPGGGIEGAIAFAPSLYVNEQGQMRMFMGVDGNDTHTCHYDTAPGLISYDTWQHVTIVYDGSLFSFYVDGDLVESSNTVCADVELPLGTLDIGRPTPWPLLYFNNVNFTNFCGTRMNVGINLDGDVSQANIWARDNSSVDPPLNNKIDLAYQIDQIPRDAEHAFRLYRNPPSYDSNDPSYVHKTGLSNITLGKFSDSFSEICNSDGTESDFGKLDWSMSNDFFQGSLNDFRIHQRTLSAQEVLDNYQSDFGLYFPLDEPPGSTVFNDAYESGVQGICSGGSCPDSGIPGIANQAAHFDGDDYLRIVGSELLGQLDINFQISAWIKPDKVTGRQRIIAAERTNSVNGFSFGLDGDRLLFTLYGDEDFVSDQVTITPGVWQHVSVAYVQVNEIDRGVVFWLNGEWKGGAGFTDPFTALNPDDLYRIGSSTHVNGTAIDEPFYGLIDEVIILNRATYEGYDIPQIRDRAPVMNLHLDEDFRSASFHNDGQVDTPASGSAGAGDKGQVREAATFNGSQSLTVPANVRFNNADYSVGLWVKPLHNKGIDQYLITKTAGQFYRNNFRLWIIGKTLQVSFDKQYACEDRIWDYTGVGSNGPLLENQWSHVMAVHDTQAKTMTLYINGVKSGEATNINPSVCTDSQPISIGQNFSGGMDEVAYWSTALSSHEVAELYDYQSRWFDVKETHVIKVDTDNPSVSLDLKESYLAPGSQIVGVTATDPTSDITEVAYRVGSSGPYQVLTPTNGKWTFTLDVPDSPDGILIQLRAIDSVGHQTFSSHNFFSIDYTPPEISHVATPFTILDNTELALNATIVDSEAGVDKGSVRFALRDRNGILITPQIPGVLDESAAGFKCNGKFCNWKAQFPITQPLYGEYTVEVTAADIFGNSVTSTAKSFKLDTIGPHADVVLEAGTPITPGLTLKGVASDIEHLWSSRTLHLHFEEEIDDYTFVDPSKNEMIATCDTRGSNNDKPLPPGQAAKCPTAAQSGKYGGAASFDGVDDRLIIQHPVEINNTAVIDVPVSEQLGLYDSSFTVMAWVNGSNWSGDHAVLGTDPLVADEGLLLGMRDGKPILSFYTNDTVSPNALPTGAWHHVTWRYDAKTGEQAIFVDGLLDTADTGHAPFIGTGTVYVGRAAGSDDFGGLIDELVVYPIPLTGDQIYNIAIPVGAAILDVEVRLRHIDDQGIADTEGVWHQAQLTPATDFTTWQFTVPESTVPGSYKIDTRATDSLSASAVLNAVSEQMDRESLLAAVATADRDNVRVAGGVYVGYIPGEPVDRSSTFFMPLVGRP